MISRRTFVKAAGASLAGLAVNPGKVFASTAASMKNIKGAGDKVNVAFIGIGQKGNEESKFAWQTGLCNVLALCDVNMGHPWTQEIMAIPDHPFANSLLAGTPSRKGWEDYYEF